MAEVWWRPRATDGSLRRTERLWLGCTLAHVVPFIVVALLLAVLKPLLAPISLLALAQAWIIPELYAARGAKVLRAPRPPRNAAADRKAAERGGLGTWVLGEAGAVLVRPGGRRVHCYCVKPTDTELPSADRIAHLLLALRADEAGFATVANVAFCGARWRLRRRLGDSAREALDAAG